MSTTVIMSNGRHSRLNTQRAPVSDGPTQKRHRQSSERPMPLRSRYSQSHSTVFRFCLHILCSKFPKQVPRTTVAEFASLERQNQDRLYFLFNQYAEPELQDCLTQLLLLEKAKQDVLARARRELGGSQALQDYQMQLMLLEQQNKKRLMLARMEQAEEQRQQLGQERSR